MLMKMSLKTMTKINLLAVTRVIEELQSTRKYRELAPSILEFAAADACARYAKPKEAVKAAKRKLHQVYGMYAPLNISAKETEPFLKLLHPNLNHANLREMTSPWLQRHQSSRERLGDLSQIAELLLTVMPAEAKILDLACGWNPLALPWFNSPFHEYCAVDIDESWQVFIQTYFDRLAWPYRAVCATVQEILATPQSLSNYNVIWLWKALPNFAQQDKLLTKKLRQNLQPQCWVISFPTATVCGHKKSGMAAHYEQQLLTEFLQSDLKHQEFHFSNEVFHVFQQQLL